AEPERATAGPEQRDGRGSRRVRTDRVNDKVGAGAHRLLEHGRLDDRVREQSRPRAALLTRFADDDPARAVETRDDGGEHPDRPGAEDDDRAGKGKRAQPERVDAGCDGLGEHGDVGVEVVLDDMDAACRHCDELSEPARARAADELAVLADVLGSRAAARTDAARDLWVHGHAAADEVLATASRVDHLPDELVAHDQRWCAARTPGRDTLDVAAADPGALDPDQHLAF